MSYSTLLPVFPSQSHFPVFPSAPPIPGAPPFPRASPSTAAPAGPSSFKAPAHKHAHHLHSIPPREKSTRTLIIDHMLWVHARTRFAQARAELGMTDRTGGVSSPNFCFRERPEQYDEEDETASDGENIDQLKARGAGHGDAHHEDEDTRMQKQDFALARCLRLRAIALEKVVTSMLDQPPPLHPVPALSDELQSPPGSPKRRPSQSPMKASHPHTLPNGVRLRLALGTVINDLFARQAPIAPYRHHHHPPPIVVSNSLSEKESAESQSLSPNGSPVPQNPSPHPSTSTTQSYGGVAGVLPPSLMVLASISGDSGTRPPSLSPAVPVSAVPGQRIVQPGTHVLWSDRVRSLYMEGADPSTANSPPALRCPRHLHTGCEICVEAKQLVKAPGGPAKGKNNTNAWGGETTSRPPQIGSGKSMGGSCGGITGWQDGSGIGSGLAHPGINGSALRRKSKWLHQDADDAGYAGSGAGNTRLSELIPRFLRLSALVATELGRELGDEEYERDSQRSTRGPSASPQMSMHRKAQSESETSPLRPSRDWYMLFAGLLTRAALEGYLTGGWRGPAPASCLLSVGLGLSDDPLQSDEDDGDFIFEWFDPDDLPTLKEAAQIMFPSLSSVSSGVSLRRENAEAEFEAEMKERLRRFCAIPSLTPDLSTHMEDLAWHYPAEPVERAAVRFCEAVAKWHGKPELETYKKRSKDPATPAMTIESLVHSNPTSPTTGAFSTQPTNLPKSKRPPIEQYFVLPHPLTGHKRRRSADDGERLAKRVHDGVLVASHA